MATASSGYDSNSVSSNPYNSAAASNGSSIEDGQSANGQQATRPNKLKTSVRRKLRVVKQLASKAVHKVQPHPFADESQPALNHVRHDAAFNPSLVEKELTQHRKRTIDIASHSQSAAESALELTIHPMKAIRKKIKHAATSRLTPAQQSKEDEFRFLNANHELNDPDRGTVLAHLDSETRGKVLEDRRDSLRTAWTMSHLRRVKVIRRRNLSYPSLSSFRKWEEASQQRTTRWLQWLGNVLLYQLQDVYPRCVDDFEDLPFDEATFRTHIERLVLNSGHWQTSLMTARSIYRWDEPTRTVRWLLLYTFLWYFDLIPVFFWSFIIYYPLSNKFNPQPLQNLQAAAERSLDRNSTAFQLGELFDRHGEEEWLDKLAQEIGPHAQLQLGDLASLLEILENFYAWKYPWKSAWTICFFASCLSCSVFGDLRFCMKILWFAVGGAFFFCWPISSRYPKYRLLVSPVRWVFWGIPTHEELSFDYLRRHAQLSREELSKRKVTRTKGGSSGSAELQFYAGNMSTPDSNKQSNSDGMSPSSSEISDEEDWQSVGSAPYSLAEDNLMSFRAQWKGIGGRIHIYSTGLCFCRNNPKRQLWDMPFRELAEIWKTGGGGRRKVTISGIFDSGGLQLKDVNGNIRTLEPIKHRDQVFNCIIGFSALPWQGIQMEPEKGR